MKTPRLRPPMRAQRDQQQHILENVLHQLESSARPALAIFDIDSTLVDNRPRQALLLREYGASIGHSKLQEVTSIHVDGWDLRVAMVNAGISPEEAESLFPEAKAFWRDRFFLSEYCVHDEEIPGAREFLQHCLSRGATIVYLTGRDVGMGPGTVENFRSHGFPLPDDDRVFLLLKPVLEMGDDSWKEEAHNRVRGMGRVVAAFDNEPTHINAYRVSFPEAFSIHLDTDHSGRPVEILEGISSIEDFVLVRA